MPDNYPKTLKLKNEAEVTLHLMTKDDGDKLAEFFRELPEEDRLFLKEDVTDRKVIDQWVENLDYDVVVPILAEHEGRVVGDGSLHFQRRGWARHCGRLRVVVAKDFQKLGLGTILTREIFLHAVKKGLEIMVAEMMETQIGAIRAFEKIGFKKEAVLKNLVTDLKGQKHDLVIMTNDVESLWKTIDEQMTDMNLSMEY